jgi:hypothetical protein
MRQPHLQVLDERRDGYVLGGESTPSNPESRRPHRRSLGRPSYEHMTQLTKTLDAMRLHSLQDKAVADYLIEHHEINRDFAYDHGLPACGRIKNLGARILELRKKGWHIDTQVRNGVCWYKLISVPAPLQLTLV